LLSFTCNICEQKTLRRVNPAALETGTTFVQCRRVQAARARQAACTRARLVFACRAP
jgi:hypothetical protein